MTYVIVGAAAGVGRALATRFAAAGHDLLLVASEDRDLRATAADLAIRHGVRARWVAADAAAYRTCAERIATAADELGGFDGVLFPIGAVAATDDCRFDPDRTARLLDVNFSAVAAITTRLLPHLLTRPRATIVGFGSVAATRGRSKNVAYSAAKRALASFFARLPMPETEGIVLAAPAVSRSRVLDLVTVVFRGQMIWLRVFYRSGEEGMFRLVTFNRDTGFWLSPLPPAFADLPGQPRLVIGEVEER